jgi:hypothetical protein
MIEKKYADLVKRLIVKDPPRGLYDKPMIWMEGSDLEGFSAQFAYTIITETGSFHPLEGAVAHPYDEVLMFAGTDPKDILFLGAEISVEIGAEREEYIFTEPTVITIPRGVPHGPVRVRRLYKPIRHYIMSLDPIYQGEKVPASILAAEPAIGGGERKYANLVKKALVYVDEILDSYDPLYSACCDKRGVMSSKLAPKGMLGPGNSDELIWMFGKDLHGFEMNFTLGNYSGAGKWHRLGETHKHPEEEILVFVGYNPDDLTDLGCGICMGLGEEAERNSFDYSAAVVCPKGFAHLPEITTWVDKPYTFIVFCLSGDHGSPWDEVDERVRYQEVLEANKE